MTKELILEFSQKLIVPLVVAVFASQGLWKIIELTLKRKFEKEDKNDDLAKVFDELKSIQDNLNNIKVEIAEIRVDVKKNNKATNALLYSELDKWINKMELIQCWSSESKKNFDDIMAMYLELGDGHSDELKQRADAIPVNNTMFHEKLSKYNNHKISVMNN